jgi:hypothetical protein
MKMVGIANFLYVVEQEVCHFYGYELIEVPDT